MQTIQQEIDERTNLTSSNKLELLLFRLGDDANLDRNELFGINVFKIREIIPMPTITAMAGSHPHMMGVVDLRGQILPVVTRGFSDESVRAMDFRSGEGVVGRVIVTKRSFICNDTTVDTRISTRLTEPEGIRSFMHVPIVVGDLVEVHARVVSVGRTSMRIRVEVSKEDPIAGTSQLCTVGHFTMVAMGPDGKPTPVPDRSLRLPNTMDCTFTAVPRSEGMRSRRR